ncbi:MAG: ribulose 1,5-bisphosphate carboxylase [Rhodomicrobium sp.]|nr:ribulose 1,5-bisphosphate carboxylase [Rhodomicrobium sp.]
MQRMTVVYRVRSDAGAIEAQAQAIAIEQSVEMPLSAISDEAVLRDIVGEVRAIRELATGLFEVRIGLSVASTGLDAGQLLNVLFGNTSLQEDVTLHDAEILDEMTQHYGGPNLGITGLRELCGAKGRALTCTALKPQGLPPEELAALAGRLAAGGLDFIKDDHGLADQVYSPFRDRVRACANAVRRANKEMGSRTRYLPNVSGDLRQAAAQIELAVAEGIGAVLIEPMIFGLSNFHRLVRDFPKMAFFAHPAMAGASRIAPPLLLGKLFRLFGADVTIYPNYGGRFSYTPETCKAIADEARRDWPPLKPCMPSPAGGMTLDRVPELLDFYGPDTMLLIGGSLLSAKDRLTEEAAAFAGSVVRHFEGTSHG